MTLQEERTLDLERHVKEWRAQFRLQHGNRDPQSADLPPDLSKPATMPPELA
jgi:hypothetical protein